MAKSPASPAIEIALEFSRSTKGTHVYDMTKDGVAIGGVYLQKLLFKAEPPKKMSMVITPTE